MNGPLAPKAALARSKERKTFPGKKRQSKHRDHSHSALNLICRMELAVSIAGAGTKGAEQG